MNFPTTTNPHSRNPNSYNFIDPILQTGSKFKISNENHPHHFFSTINTVNTYVESKLGSEIHSKEAQVNRSLKMLFSLANREAENPKKKLNFFKKLFRRKRKKVISFSDKIKISNECNTTVPHVIIMNEDEDKNLKKNDKTNKFYSTFSYKDLRFNRKIKGEKETIFSQNNSPVIRRNINILEKKISYIPYDKKTSSASNSNVNILNDLIKTKNKNHSKVNSIVSVSSVSNQLKYPDVKMSYENIKSKLSSYESIKTNFKSFSLNTVANTERNKNTENNNTLNNNTYNITNTQANSNVGSTFLTLAKETFSSNFRVNTQCTTDRNSTSNTTNQGQVTSIASIATESNQNSNQKPIIAVKKIIHKKNKSAITEVNKKFQDKIKEFKSENSVSIPYSYRIRVSNNNAEKNNNENLKNFNNKNMTNIQLSSIILNTNSTTGTGIHHSKNKSLNFENNLSRNNLNFNFNFTPRQGYENTTEDNLQNLQSGLNLPNLKSATEEQILDDVRYFQKHGKLYHDPNDHASGHMLKENIKELNSQIDKKGVFIHMNKNKLSAKFFSMDRTNVFHSGDDISRINDGASIKFQNMLASKFNVKFTSNEVYGLEMGSKPVQEKKSNMHDMALQAYHSHVYKKMEMFKKHNIKDSVKKVKSSNLKK
jgi:hypothetical protein